MKKRIQIVGLTGGIASGKSTVASFLREEAAIPVIDADTLGHLVLASDGSAYKAVVEEFGDQILDPSGEIDRQKLGEQVFDNAERRAKLEAITHPAIAALSQKAIEMTADRDEPLVIYEAALLVETNVHKGLDALIVVSCSVETQLMRIMARNKLSAEAAAARIASQYPLEEKIKVADYVIDNNSDIERVRELTLELAHQLKKRFPKKK